MADELIDVFDENNNSLGIKLMKSEAHKKGLWHRAAHVWIYNSKGEVLLQLRAKDKEFFPDRWDISVAGHVSAGESPAVSPVREIKEEIGLEISEKELEFMRVMKYSIDVGVLKNREFIYVLTLKYEGDLEELKRQEEEIQELRFFHADFVKKDVLKNPDKYTPGEEYWLEMMEWVEKHHI